jgi:hypothetical protein
MTGKEIVEQIRAQKNENHAFIKWWRKEEDWIDYDLIDRFVATAKEDENIDGYELVGIDDLWQQLQRLCPDRVAKVEREGQNLVTWSRTDGQRRECLFGPQSLLEIFDSETRGNYVD